MQSPFQLDRDLDINAATLTQINAEAWRIRVTISDQWQVIVGPNGGYLGALLLAGVKRLELPSGQFVRSMAINFISPSIPGPAELVLSVIKRGRTTSLFQSCLNQGDRSIARATVALGSDRLPISFCDQTMPALPSPTALTPIDWSLTQSNFAVPFRRHYDQRVGLGPTPGEKDDSGCIGGWMRFKDLRPIDDLSLIAMSDGWYPSIISRNLPRAVHVPSLDHTVHFLCSDFSSFDAEAFVMFEFSTELAAAGYLIENGRMFSEAGQLLAVSRQMAAMVPFED